MPPRCGWHSRENSTTSMKSSRRTPLNLLFSSSCCMSLSTSCSLSQWIVGTSRYCRAQSTSLRESMPSPSLSSLVKSRDTSIFWFWSRKALICCENAIKRAPLAAGLSSPLFALARFFAVIPLISRRDIRDLKI